MLGLWALGVSGFRVERVGVKGVLVLRRVGVWGVGGPGVRVSGQLVMNGALLAMGDSDYLIDLSSLDSRFWALECRRL